MTHSCVPQPSVLPSRVLPIQLVRARSRSLALPTKPTANRRIATIHAVIAIAAETTLPPLSALIWTCM